MTKTSPVSVYQSSQDGCSRSAHQSNPQWSSVHQSSQNQNPDRASHSINQINQRWNFPHPEDELLSKSQAFFDTLNPFNTNCEPDVLHRIEGFLSPDFTFVSADTDACMSKKHCLNYQQNLWQSFVTPSFHIDAEFYGHNVDQMHQGRVWCFCRLKMTQKADFFGKKMERTPAILCFPPQAHSLDWTEAD